MVINHPGEVCGTVTFVGIGTAQVEHLCCQPAVGVIQQLALEGKGWVGVQDMQAALKGTGNSAGSKFMNTCGV